MMHNPKTFANDVENFNRHLDALIQDHHLPIEELQSSHREMFTIARALIHNSFDSLSTSKAPIQQKVSNKPRMTPTKPYLRKIAAVGALLPIVIFIVACAVSPTLRARTKEVLIQIGHLVFTDDPTDAQKALPYKDAIRPTPVIDETGEPHRWVPLTQEEASRLVEFQVLVPHVVPEQEWEKAFRPEWGNPKEISWEIFESPAGGIYVNCDCFRFHRVIIRQQRSTNIELEEFAIADAQIAEVTVRGLMGYWIEDAPTSLVGGGGSALSLTEDDIVWQISYNNYLVWEENGVLYMVSGSDELSLEDFYLVAESLAP
ncbi:MAG: hypothetical protein WBB65_03110 [Anaerolineales bacterium]